MEEKETKAIQKSVTLLSNEVPLTGRDFKSHTRTRNL